MKQTDELLLEARETVQTFSDSLPKSVDAKAIATRSKIPLKVLCYREGLIWRAEELARAACDCFERSDDVAGIILTRGVTETAAAAWYLRDLMQRQVEKGVQPDLDEKVMRLLLGHRNESDMPVAINVLNFLDAVDRTVPGVRKLYE